MKKILFGLIAAVGGTASILCITAARHQDSIRPNTKVGPVEVGGMTPDEAARALRVWWESEKIQALKVVCAGRSIKLPDMKPGELGVTLDDAASISSLPLQSFAGDAKALVTQEDFSEESHPLVFKSNGLSTAELAKRIKDAVGPNRPARVFYRKGAIYREPEVAGVALDLPHLPDAVAKAVDGETKGKVILPLAEAEKHVPDESLKEIKQVVAEFSTRFSAGNRPRSANIKLAASKIDGLVLMPGEKFSFNGSVGRRTLKAGFKLAGVYVNGKHDTGVGGGICQVSTTLYNSALFANLAIRSRSNHSLPVPYVPLGRDATVDYGNIDLVVENTYQTPIALSSHYVPGRLTFRVLGRKEEGLSVKVAQEGARSWAVGTQKVLDPKLPSGRTKVVEPGSTARSVRTYRLVYKNGKLLRREPLGSSRYGGDARVIAVGTGPALAPKAIAPKPTVNIPDENPPVPPVDEPPTNDQPPTDEGV